MNGDVNPAGKVDQLIDFSLKDYAHKTMRNYLFGIKKWFELNEVKVNWDKTKSYKDFKKSWPELRILTIE